MLDELAALIARSGATMTFDARRYARAAQSWPDYLPPMFGPESVTVERWGMASWDGMWVARRPEGWPTPTVEVGQVWEQKSILVPTWEQAARETGWFRIVQHTVVAIHGERFVNERGHDVPWSMINPDHWRRVAPGARA